MTDRPPTPDGDPVTRLRDRAAQMRADSEAGALLSDSDRLYMADLTWLVDRMETILGRGDDLANVPGPEPEATIESVLADKAGVAMVTRYVVVAKTIDEDGTPGWTWDRSEGMEIDQIAGMAWWLNELCEHAAAKYLAEEGFNDD